MRVKEIMRPLIAYKLSRIQVSNYWPDSQAERAIEIALRFYEEYKETKKD